MYLFETSCGFQDNPKNTRSAGSNLFDFAGTDADPQSGLIVNQR
jgi:hypothetical protein